MCQRNPQHVTLSRDCGSRFCAGDQCTGPVVHLLDHYSRLRHHPLQRRGAAQGAERTPPVMLAVPGLAGSLTLVGSLTLPGLAGLAGTLWPFAANALPNEVRGPPPAGLT